MAGGRAGRCLGNALHALPVTGCPFDRSLEVTVAAARRAVTAGAIDLDPLDEDPHRQQCRELLAALRGGCPPSTRYWS